MEQGGFLSYDGCNFFRQRLILSCLSGKSICIKNIRAKAEEPGLKDFEAAFIRLLDRISNGSVIEVNDTGTAIMFKPGVLNGGKQEFTCPNSRGIGYFLEPLLLLAPFCKMQLDVTLKGITNNELDPSVDMLQSSVLPVLKRFFIVDSDLSIKMLKRGLPPQGGGIIHFTCPLLRTLKAFQWLETGKVKKIRGIAYTSRIAPIVGNRVIEAAKGELLKFLPDVYFTSDNSKGMSPGFGLCCVAETNKGVFISAESMNSPSGSSELKLPEDVGREAAWRLMEEIWRGGCVDTIGQMIILLFMTLSPRDVCKAVIGPLTPQTMHFLRHLRDFFQITFKIDEYKEDNVVDDAQEYKTGSSKLLLTCVGVGFTNISKPQI